MLQTQDLAVELDRLQGPVFSGLTLSLDRGDKVALVGPNGAGKTTLLRTLTGEITPLKGSIRVSRGTRITMLRQELLEEGVLGDHVADSPELRRAFGRLHLSTTVLDRTVASLSPGERMRAGLAAVLAEDPDLLLLDEPTNHLDLPARDWLVNFVRHCREGVLFVTHDRDFADEAAERVLFLERGHIIEYAGGYSDMQAARGLAQIREKEAYEKSRDEIRRLKNAAESQLQRAEAVTKRPTQRTYDPKAKAFYSGKSGRMDKRAAAMRTRVEQIETPEKPFEPDAIRLVLPTLPMRGSMALEARGLTKRYGKRILFENLSLDVAPGERLAITGPNGAGKTTLLRGLLEPETFDMGEVVWGRGARPGLLTQTRRTLDLELSAVQALEDYDETAVRTLLGALGLRGDLARRRLQTLSTGERTRVELAAMLLQGANILLLDEPTNHLDLPSREALESALSDYEGAVIFVSHDRRFVETYADRIASLAKPED